MLSLGDLEEDAMHNMISYHVVFCVHVCVHAPSHEESDFSMKEAYSEFPHSFLSQDDIKSCAVNNNNNTRNDIMISYMIACYHLLHRSPFSRRPNLA